MHLQHHRWKANRMQKINITHALIGRGRPKFDIIFCFVCSQMPIMRILQTIFASNLSSVNVYVRLNNVLFEAFISIFNAK